MIRPHSLVSSIFPRLAAPQSSTSIFQSGSRPLLRNALPATSTMTPTASHPQAVQTRTSIIGSQLKKQAKRAKKSRGKKNMDAFEIDERVNVMRRAIDPRHALGRPLKFGAMRALRHWAIYRAWQLHKHKLKKERDLELERQWNKIREACEELRLHDTRLFEIATNIKGTGMFPIDMRIPTDTPPKHGFNEKWTRPEEGKL